MPKLTQKRLYQEAGSKCSICDEDNVAVLDIHHIQPRATGGSNEFSNLALLCSNCHRKVDTDETSAEALLRRKLELIYSAQYVKKEKTIPKQVPKVLLASAKGGAGRSFCTILLAAEATRLKKRVLIIDTDTRLSSSAHFFPEVRRIQKNSLHHIRKQRTLENQDISSQFFFKHTQGNIDVFAYGAYIELTWNADHFRLPNLIFLQALIEKYDICFVDSQQLDLRTFRDAVTLSNIMLIPFRPINMEYEVLSNLFDAVDQINREIPPDLSDQFLPLTNSAIFLNDTSRYESPGLRTKIVKEFQSGFFYSSIDHAPNESDHRAFKGSFLKLRKNSKLRQQAARLTQELLDRIQNNSFFNIQDYTEDSASNSA